MSENNHADPAGRQRTDTGGAERLALIEYERKAISWLQLAVALAIAGEWHKVDVALRQTKSLRQQWREEKAVRERERSGQALHGKDPQTPEVTCIHGLPMWGPCRACKDG